MHARLKLALGAVAVVAVVLGGGFCPVRGSRQRVGGARQPPDRRRRRRADRFGRAGRGTSRPDQARTHGFKRRSRRDLPGPIRPAQSGTSPTVVRTRRTMHVFSPASGPGGRRADFGDVNADAVPRRRPACHRVPAIASTPGGAGQRRPAAIRPSR